MTRYSNKIILITKSLLTMDKITFKDLGYNVEGLDEKQKSFVEKNGEMVCAIINKAMDGMLSKEEVEKQFKSVNDKMADYEEIKKQNEDLCATVKNLGEVIDKMKQKGVAFNREAFTKKFDDMFNSDRFEAFVNGRKDTTGKFDGFSLKELAIVSMTDNYEGEVLITRQDNRPVVQDYVKPLHLRDIIPSVPGDPNFLSITWPIIYDLDRNARFLSENGALPKSSFKIKEVTTSVTRLGTSIDLSKRMLKSRAYVMSFVMQLLPEAIRQAEDWNILFGDGTNNSLPGIISYQGISAVEKIISEAIVKGVAGDIVSIKPYNNNKDAVIEFSKAFDLIQDGMTIILEGCTNSSLNAPHGVIKMNDRQILVRDVNITADDTNAASATFAVNMAGFKNILTPNSEDVIRTAAAVMTIAQYRPKAIVLNPATVNMIESEKDTIGRNLGLVKIVNGVKTIAGLPIVEYSGISAGEYFLGDFTNGCLLVDYTNLSIELADDVQYKSMNLVAALAAEEVILQVRMPFAFAYGKLEAVKEAITKA